MVKMCPNCDRVPFSIRHRILCKVRPVMYDNTISSRPDPILYLIHRPHESLEYFTYKMMKELELLGKYTTWKEWDMSMFRQINWIEYYWIKEAWQEAMTDTCMSIPCYECTQREIDKGTRHAFIKKQLLIQRAQQRRSRRHIITIDERQKMLAQ